MQIFADSLSIFRISQRKKCFSLFSSLILIFCVSLLFFSGLAFGKQKSLYVHCGAAIRPPMDEIGKLFQKKYGIKIDYSYKGSGCLLADITFSHKGDLYMPGEAFFMDQAVKRGFILKRKPVAYWVAVIIVQKGNPKKIKSLFDLTRPGLRVGLGDPKAVAIGIATEKMLKKAGICPQVYHNRVMCALNVPELGIGVQLGHIDAAIVWTATAALFTKYVDVISIPAKYREVTAIPLGILKFTKDRKAAEKFFEFVTSPEGKEIFRRHGYTVNPKNIEADLAYLAKKCK